jgi:hypothetical protein
MPGATTQHRGLTDADLQELLALTERADSVELKLTIPESDQRSTAVALDLDPLEAQIRQVFFFDTPDLALNDHGVVVRSRRVQKKGEDTVVKLRPVVPAELPDRVRRSPEFGVEVDACPKDSSVWLAAGTAAWFGSGRCRLSASLWKQFMKIRRSSPSMPRLDEDRRPAVQARFSRFSAGIPFDRNFEASTIRES